MENKKYELVMDDSIVIDGIILYRIRSLKDFGSIKTGSLGGYISGEHNLSHDGDCWIYDDAYVYDNAMVSGNAIIYGNAKVYGNAVVYGNSRVSFYAEVYDDARVFGNASVCNNSKVYNYANVYGDSEVSNNAEVYNTARIFDRAEVYGSKVYGLAKIHDNAMIYEGANIYGDVSIGSNVIISSNADISSDKDYLCIKGLVYPDMYTTIFNHTDCGPYIKSDYFDGTLDTFESVVKEISNDDSLRIKEYMMLIDICKLHFGLSQDKKE